MLEKNPTLITIVSIVIGFGFALMFQRKCTSNCVVVELPHDSEIQDKYFKMEGNCYQYKKVAAECKAGEGQTILDTRAKSSANI